MYLKRISNIFVLLSTLLSITYAQVTVDGYAFLENQTDHSGIQVLFERTAPSALLDSTYTDASGYFSIELEIGVYDVTYSKGGYFNSYLYDQSLFSNTTLTDITLLEHTTLINVPADFPTIQSAIIVTLSGDTILVAPGTYVENINFLGKGITVGSLFITTQDTNYISQTIINGNWNGSVVTFESGEDSTALLSGMKLINGTSGQGGGINCTGSHPTLDHLVIMNNSGGGIYCYNANPVINKVNIVGNYGVGIEIRSESSVRLIDSEVIGSARGIHVGWSSNLIMEGGNVANNSSSASGGGIYCDYANGLFLNNVIIDGNSANGINSHGGGIYIAHSSNVILQDVIISNNSADRNGGGIFSSSPCKILGTTIIGNEALNGGGLSISGTNADTSYKIQNSTITQNIATGGGGGVNINGNGIFSPIFSEVEISYNQAQGFANPQTGIGGGGGINISTSSPILKNVNIHNNTARDGGGIYVYDYNFDISIPIIENVRIHNNSATGNWGNGGGGIYFRNIENVTLQNVTIMNNSALGNQFACGGGGIYIYDASPSIVNSILSQNTGNYGVYLYSSGTPSFTYSDFSDNEGGNFYNVGNWIGVNVTTNANGDSCDLYYNIQLDPLFVDPDNGDYHLQAGSPSIDAGDPTLPLDPDGTVNDQGAYYYDQSTIPTIISVPDTIAIEDSLYSYQLSAVGIPSPTFSLLVYPEGMTIDTTGLIYWLPNNNDVGDTIVSCTAINNLGSDTQTFNLHINNINDPPSIITTGLYDAIEDQTYNFTIQATDEDIIHGDNISYSLSISPEGMTINNNTGEIIWMPDNNDVGDTTITIIVTDDSSATDSKTFSLLVRNTNDSPFIANPLQNIVVNEDADSTVIDLNGVFADDDIDVAGDSLILNVSNDNVNLITALLEGFTLTLSYIADQNGIANIVVTATDDSSTSVADTFVVTVNPVTDIPIAVSQSITINEDTPIEITLTGSDADGDSLYYPILTLPVNGTLSGRPDTLIVFNVTDFQAGPADGNYWMFDQDATPFIQDASSVYAYEGFQGVSQTASTPIAENLNILTGLNGVTVYMDSLVISSFEHVNVVSGGAWNTLGEAGDRRIYSNGIGEIQIDGVTQLRVENLTFMLTTYYPDPIGPGGVDGYADGFGYGVINGNVSDPNWVAEFDPNNTGLVEFDFQSFSPTVQGYYGSFDVLSLTITPISDNSITYQPNLNFNGSDEFLFVALDGTALSDPATLIITINPVNDFPVIANPLIDIEVNEDAGDTVIDLDSVFTDVDIETNTDSLVLSVASNNTDLLNVSLSGLLLTLSYNSNQNGSADIFISATDDSSVTVTDTFSVIVNSINDQPYLSQPLPDVTVDEDDFGAIIIPRLEDYFADVDSMDHLVFNGAALDAGLDSLIIETNGGMTFAQRYGLGHISPELRSQKRAVLSVKRSQVKIKQNKLFNGGKQPDQTFNPEIRTRTDGKDTYSSLSRQTQADTTALIVYPTFNFNGDIRIVVTATDDSSASVSDTLFLTVMPINDLPVLTALADTSILEDDTLQVTLFAYDLDGDTLIFSAESDTSALNTIVTDTILTLIPNANWNGISEITVGVSDNDTTINEQFALSVLPLNDAPNPFILLFPVDSTIIQITQDILNDTLEIVWESSIDVDGDTVLYTLIATDGISFLTTDWIQENKLRWTFAELVELMDSIVYVSGTWMVIASDNDTTVEASNGSFALTIDATSLNVDGEELIPQVFALHQNYPNPFNPVTTIRYDVPEQSHVLITIYDILGRRIKTIVNGVGEPGFKSVVWDGKNQFGHNVSSGIYFYQIVTKSNNEIFVNTKKLVLLR